MPVSKLKTPAGVDHDYNFLSAIERARERTQRDLLGESTAGNERSGAPLFTPAQLGRDLDGERRWRREWFGEEVRFVSKDGSGRGGAGAAALMGSDGEGEEGEGLERTAAAGSSLARKVRYRLDALGTEVMRMPVGMTRQRENTTAWNRRAGRINWCVEWFVYDCPSWPSSEGDDNNSNDTMHSNHRHHAHQQTQHQQPLRIRHKALETRPLYRALGDSLAWHHKGTTKSHPDLDSDDEDITTTTTPARKRRRLLIKELKDDLRRTTPQDPSTTVFSHPTPYPTQNPYTGAWTPAHDRTATARSWLGDEVVERMRCDGWRFYLLRAPTPAGRDRELIPCTAEESLEQMLRGRTVVEFPTVYVLPPLLDEEEDKLPPGFVLGSTERRAPVPMGKRKKQQQQQAKKRKVPAAAAAAAAKGLDAASGNQNNKRQRGGGGAMRGGGRGRGGRIMTMVHREREEGEVVSGEEEAAVAAAADTTSSDPDTSSDEDEDTDMDDSGAPATGHAANNNSSSSVPAGKQNSSSSLPPLHAATKLGALVGYGSDSSDDENGDDDEEGEVTTADLASLKPEDPELVAGAIQEIVGLLT